MLVKRNNLNLPAKAKGFIKFGLICLMMAQVHAASSQTLKGDTWAEAQKKGSGELTYTYIETPGFSYLDNAGKVQGICVDIMDHFVDYVEKNKQVKLSVKYQGQTDDFKKFYSNVKNGSGGVFGLGNITITDVRKKEVKFSPAFINNVTVLLTHNSVATLGALPQIAKTFEGMTAYTIKGTTNEKQLLELKTKYYPAMKVEYLPSSPEVIAKVASDPNTFTNLDFTYFLDAIKEKKPIKRHPSGDYDAEEFGMIMPLNTDWGPLLDEFLVNFKKTTEYRQILAKHLGVNAVKMLKNVG
jgi:ABC-type amino acid transport substrate-binding protein